MDHRGAHRAANVAPAGGLEVRVAAIAEFSGDFGGAHQNLIISFESSTAFGSVVARRESTESER